jgi:predicted dienelactone hydrolase
VVSLRGTPQQHVDIGGKVVIGTRDCPIVGDKLPLIVVSHGRAGWFGGHHDTAAALADAGLVVAAINHPGDTATDKSRVDDLSVFVERPLEIKRLIDFILGAPDSGKIDREGIGLFGFSMGGYTGLVVAG